MKMKLTPKEKAPDFDLADQDGKRVSLSDFKGRKVLLFFYPKAGTSG
jgi:peroxiredoxin Q/BCP